MENSPKVGLYVHIPFCRAKCTYCDFNSYPGLESLFDRYAAAVAREIERAGPARFKTVYIGGGTPTVLPLSHLGQVLKAAGPSLANEARAEVSIEANPGTVDGNKLGGLLALGVNRLSLGVQSFHDGELHLLGRIHSAAEAIAAFHAARQAGFDNINLDLLYGVPGQGLDTWQASLEQALDLGPDHLSLYALTIEEGTPLAVAIARGELEAPDPDLAADMYELAEDSLATAGFLHYEISNWASTAAYRCQHNLVYWRNEPYLGVGAGAHSWLGGRRWCNTAWPAGYAEQVLAGRRPVAEEELIGRELEMGETMMMGLRLLGEGIDFGRFCQRLGVDPRQWYKQELAELAGLGLIEIQEDRVVLSRRGYLLGNQAFLRFLPD